uniref:Pancreatic trypsin inhibitor n=1 Tax=Rhipicephalus zambeziensis TaxID=60191 RepID=A0A224YIG5_9ACAR
MSLTFLILWGCIISALVWPSHGCKKCCGSCTRPKRPACPDIQEGRSGSNKRYFPNTDKKRCTAASSQNCKGKFYSSEHECKSCCQSFLK